MFWTFPAFHMELKVRIVYYPRCFGMIIVVRVVNSMPGLVLSSCCPDIIATRSGALMAFHVRGLRVSKSSTNNEQLHRPRTVLTQLPQVYSTYILLHVHYGASIGRLGHCSMSWLTSFALYVLHAIYNVANIISSFQQHLTSSPRPLNVQRKQVPSHLALLLALDDKEQTETLEACMLDNVENVVSWCREVGIRRLTLYDRGGALFPYFKDIWHVIDLADVAKVYCLRYH